jgi:3-oxoadipate enol-lactonase
MAAVALHHRVTGPLSGEFVLLGGSLGSTHRIWDELVPELADYQVVAFDIRGHGDSPSAVGPISVADLASDVVALAGIVGAERFHYVGLSLGGAIGQQLALDAPHRLLSLTLACTSARFADADTWLDRAAAVRDDGMEQLRTATAGRWFTDEVRLHQPGRVAEILDELVATDPASYAAVCESLAGFDLRRRVGEITAPTLVITADGDPTPPPDLPGAEHVLLEHSAHLANVCRPEAFASVVREHLGAHRAAR